MTERRREPTGGGGWTPEEMILQRFDRLEDVIADNQCKTSSKLDEITASQAGLNARLCVVEASDKGKSKWIQTWAAAALAAIGSWLAAKSTDAH